MLELKNNKPGRKKIYLTEEEKKKAQYEQSKRQVKEKQYSIRLALHKEYDAALIEWLKSQPNKNGYLKKLIVDDINRKAENLK